MIESKIKWKRTNLPYRRSPNILYSYYPHREVEHHSPSLNCGLCMATSFQWGQYEEEESSGEIWWTLPRPGDWGQSQQWKVMLIICFLGMLKCKITFASVIFLPKAHNPCLIFWKISDKSQLSIFWQNTWSALYKTVNVIKTRKACKTITVKRHLRSHDNST